MDLDRLHLLHSPDTHHNRSVTLYLQNAFFLSPTQNYHRGLAGEWEPDCGVSGYGDMAPETSTEKIFTTCYVLVGFCLLGDASTSFRTGQVTGTSQGTHWAKLLCWCHGARKQCSVRKSGAPEMVHNDQLPVSAIISASPCWSRTRAQYEMENYAVPRSQCLALIYSLFRFLLFSCSH